MTRAHRERRLPPPTIRRGCAVGVLLAMAGSALSTPARAEDPPVEHAPTNQDPPQTRSRVLELMRQGNTEAEAGRFREAARAYRSAWRLERHYAIALSLAETETELGNYLEAAELWEYYLAHVPPDRRDPGLDAEAQLTACREQLVAVQIAVPGPSARVLVNGAEIGRTPIASQLWVKPGRHVLQARRDDRWSEARTIIVDAGDRTSVTLEFAPEPAAPPQAEPASAVDSMPRDEVSAVVSTPRDEVSSLAPRQLTLIAGGVLSAAALGVGIGYWWKSRRLSNETTRLRRQLETPYACSEDPSTPACRELRSKVAEHNRVNGVPKPAFVTAGALAVATLATYSLWPTDHARQANTSARRVLITPWVAGDTRGLHVFTAF